MNKFIVAAIENFNRLSNYLSRIRARILRFLVACLCLENCRLCSRELSLSLGQDYREPGSEQRMQDFFPSNELEKAAHAISKVVCTESVLPAILKGADTSFFDRKYSHCLCYECFLDLDMGKELTVFCKLKNSVQSKLPIVSGATYENKVRDLIGRFKYDSDRLLATDLSYVMLSAWSELSERIPASNTVLVAVPLHKHRMRNRGFNQSELLARNLSLATDILHVSALIRTVHTKPQQTLGREERLKNVKGAFKVRTKFVQGKNIILVDDVCTSGATLTECAEVLLKEGAASVAAITIARAVFWERRQEDGKDAA